MKFVVYDPRLYYTPRFRDAVLQSGGRISLPYLRRYVHAFSTNSASRISGTRTRAYKASVVEGRAGKGRGRGRGRGRAGLTMVTTIRHRKAVFLVLALWLMLGTTGEAGSPGVGMWTWVQRAFAPAAHHRRATVPEPESAPPLAPPSITGNFFHLVAMPGVIGPHPTYACASVVPALNVFLCPGQRQMAPVHGCGCSVHLRHLLRCGKWIWECRRCMMRRTTGTALLRVRGTADFMKFCARARRLLAWPSAPSQH